MLLGWQRSQWTSYWGLLVHPSGRLLNGTGDGSTRLGDIRTAFREYRTSTQLMNELTLERRGHAHNPTPAADAPSTDEEPVEGHGCC